MRLILPHKFTKILTSAILLSLGFTKSFFWIPAWFGLVPFFLALKEATSFKEAFKSGYVLGLLFFLFTVFWMMHVAFIGMILAVLILATYLGVFALLSWKSLSKPILSIFLIPTFFTALEFIRGEIPHFGMGFVKLGYSQVGNLPILQFANLFGSYGLTWIIVFVNVCVFVLLSLNIKQRLVGGVVLALLFGGLFASGVNQMDSGVSTNSVRVSVVQPNIAQKDKWNPELKDKVIEKVIKLAQLAQYEGGELIVLPEAVYPGALNHEFFGSLFESFSQTAQTPLLVGAPYISPENNLFNSAYWIKSAKIESIHHKLVLVPFGEYVPLRPLFRLFGLDRLAYALGVGTFQAGSEYTLFPLRKGVEIGSLVCFEDSLPYLARKFVKEGADILVNITNDAWFGKTRAPHQHLQASILRAVENRVPVIRAANTGVSAFISPFGELLGKVENEAGQDIYASGIKTAIVTLKEGKTLYQQGGYLFPWITCALSVLTLFLGRKHPT